MAPRCLGPVTSPLVPGPSFDKGREKWFRQSLESGDGRRGLWPRGGATFSGPAPGQPRGRTTLANFDGLVNAVSR
ncbi:MAG: hypothetical protein QOC69_4850 [Mycobacterium sp.]|jgi:hypothetical protein|nr:hypothetical protein [Mycobacterium sp.]